MESHPTILYLTSENTTTSIPLELAIYMRKSNLVHLYVAAYYGAVPGEPLSPADDVINLNVPRNSIWQGVRKVNRLVKKIKPDILHVHHNLSALIAIWVARYHKVKMIIKTEHNDHRFMKWHQKILNIPILFSADLVICNSVSTKNSFTPLEKWLADRKAISIYNGINVQSVIAFSNDKNRCQTKKKYGITHDEKLFVCAARLIKQKNFENLIKGFAYACDENKNIRLLIAGSGYLYNDLLALKKRVDGYNKIDFLGILPREEIYQLMNAADFFVMLSHWEGFCNAVVEAMIARCPVICSDIVTLREVVGDAGCFVHPNSPDEIKEAILQFAAFDDEMIKQMGEKSFTCASQLFAIDNTANAYIDQYLKANTCEKENHLYSRV